LVGNSMVGSQLDLRTRRRPVKVIARIIAPFAEIGCGQGQCCTPLRLCA
jgi:hypothetical protein